MNSPLNKLNSEEQVSQDDRQQAANTALINIDKMIQEVGQERVTGVLCAADGTHRLILKQSDKH